MTIVNEAYRWKNGTAAVPSLDQFHDIGLWNYRFHWDKEKHNDRTLDFRIRLHEERRDYIQRFGFALPCREALETIANLSPLVEIGAGTGFWSALFVRAGATVIATDVAKSDVINGYGFVTGCHHPVLRLSGKTAVRRFHDRNVFCSWPSLGSTWFRQAVRAMRIGRTLAIVREDAVAEDIVWDYIAMSFDLVETVEIPCWPHLHDHIQIWKKKRDAHRAEWVTLSVY